MTDTLLHEEATSNSATDTNANTLRVYTTLNENTAFTDTFTIFSKAEHYDNPSLLPSGEHEQLRKAIEALHLDVEVRPWLYQAMKLRQEGKKIAFLTDRLSLNTYKRSDYGKHPGLWNIVLCEHDMRHDRTPNVSEDYGEGKDHDGVLDMWLRSRVTQCQMRMFIKIAHAFPEVWADLSHRDGEEIRITYAAGKLTLELLSTNTTYELSVGQIRLTKETDN